MACLSPRNWRTNRCPQSAGASTQTGAPATLFHNAHFEYRLSESLLFSIALAAIEGHDDDSMRDAGFYAGESAGLSDDIGAPLQAG
jgi:hypothetical protein